MLVEIMDVKFLEALLIQEILHNRGVSSSVTLRGIVYLAVFQESSEELKGIIYNHLTRNVEFTDNPEMLDAINRLHERLAYKFVESIIPLSRRLSDRIGNISERMDELTLDEAWCKLRVGFYLNKKQLLVTIDD